MTNTANEQQIGMVARVMQMLGRPEPKAEEITVGVNGGLIVEVGKPDVKKLISKALSL